MLKQEKNYISLKKASEISGYSPDYVGQLIRSGKLSGKQVFQNVVWMTTEEDLRQYMQHRRGVSGTAQWKHAPSGLGSFAGFSRRFKREMEMPQLVTHILQAAIVLFVCLFLLLFYVFSSSLDHSIDQKAIENLEAKSTV